MLRRRTGIAILSLAVSFMIPFMAGAQPLAHPPGQGENACFYCHASLSGRNQVVAEEWAGSIHAVRGVGCADCHGGDPTAQEMAAAMSPQAGFIGVPRRADIPELCGSCHADAEKMRIYNLPTDQLRQYRQESVHGQRLAQGDENVATCYDCHGGHNIREANDPGSTVYPVNLPGTCARCHANADLMAPYGIPTNQYALFKESAHGIALVQEHNLRAPTCATCHGNHGASLPGYTEVVDICGADCHPAVREAYLTGGHGLGFGVTKPEVPRCVSCHGRYNVPPASTEMYLGNAPRHCGSCHGAGTLIREQVDAIYQDLTDAAQGLARAEAAIGQAQSTGLATAAEEVKLQQARTRLMEARIVQHTVQPELIKSKTDLVRALCADIESALDQAASARRSWQRAWLQGMTMGVVALGLVSAAGLLMVRRQSR
ncbi:MAG: cytochrome c3 family protein [Anaerolineae bacterium]